MTSLDDLFEVLKSLGDQWSWSIKTDESTRVSYSKRRILVKKKSLSLELVESLTFVMMGLYGLPSGCFSGEAKFSIDQNLEGVKGPGYKNNSCHLDSIMAFLSFSPYPAYRRLIVGSSEPSNTVIKEILIPGNTCSIIRKILFGRGHQSAEAIGHTYDLLTDRFFKLKIPVVTKNQTIFYSSIPVEDILSGDISVRDINHRILVLENHLGYSHPFSYQNEPNRPPKVTFLKKKMRDYALIGIIYHSGLGPSKDQDVYSTKKLGEHYYLVFSELDGKQYVYDDLDPTIKIDPFSNLNEVKTSSEVLLEDPSKRGKDIGVLYFYYKTTPLHPQSIVVTDETTISFQPKFFEIAKSFVGVAKSIKFSKSRGKAVFENSGDRKQFESILRESKVLN